jgi:tryptophan 2,3-dioxygenase
MSEPAASDYSSYLRLDQVLSAQQPLSDHHDEMLFIVVHQAKELWMKVVLHELGLAQRCISGDDLGPAFKALARVARAQEVLIRSWDPLSTMTPADYLQFRHRLGSASGFQSVQYRAIEYTLGRRDPRYLEAHRGEDRRRLEGLLAAPSLYDQSLLLLHRRGFPVAEEVTGRDWSRQHHPHPSVLEAWVAVYRDPETHWDLYELAEKLVDLEHAFSRWRFEHYKTVHRIIGNKPGTGGTSGLGYLKTALDFVFFPELWEVRTRL